VQRGRQKKNLRVAYKPCARVTRLQHKNRDGHPHLAEPMERTELYNAVVI
jgi:hypothetical protein